MALINYVYPANFSLMSKVFARHPDRANGSGTYEITLKYNIFYTIEITYIHDDKIKIHVCGCGSADRDLWLGDFN